MKTFIKKTLLCAGMAMLASGAYAEIKHSGNVSITGYADERGTVVAGDDYDSRFGLSGQLDLDAALGEKGKTSAHMSIGTGDETHDTIYLVDSATADNITIKAASLSQDLGKAKVTVGKINRDDEANKVFSDIIVDDNFNPEGANVRLSMDENDDTTIDLAGWLFEHKDTVDTDKNSYLLGINAEHKLAGITANLGYYQVEEPAKAGMNTHATTNVNNTGIDIKPLVVGLSYKVKDVDLHGQIFHNIASGVSKDKDTGYSLKASYKINEEMKVSAEYRMLEKDAVFANLTDRDFSYAGMGTDVKGFILQADYKYDDKTDVSLKASMTEPEVAVAGKNDLWSIKAKINRSF